MENTFTFEQSFTEKVNEFIVKGHQIYESIEYGTIEEKEGAIKILQIVGAIKATAENVAETEGLEKEKFTKWQEETESLQWKAEALIK